MTDQEKSQLTVWWILWAAFQIGIFIMYHFLGGTFSAGPSSATDSLTWLAGLTPVMLSVIVRHLVLPRMPNAQAALPLFVVGIAMAEATCFLGLFIFPAHRLELFIFSALGIFQFIPTFARRYFDQNDGGRNG